MSRIMGRAMTTELFPISSPTLFRSDIRRWQTPSRWYSAAIVRDLLGDWTVVRRWGGRANRLHGQIIEVVDDYQTACRRLDELDLERQKRQYHPPDNQAP